MESNTSTPQAESLSVQARTYFLQQGQSTLNLYSILKSNLLTGFVKSGISVLLEILLYLIVFGIWLAVALYFPDTKVEIRSDNNEDVQLYAGMNHEKLDDVFFKIKLGAMSISIIPFAFARILRRNRRKRALIEDAYMEVDMMKERSEDAVKGLKL